MIYNNTCTQLNGYQFVILCGCCSFSRCNCRIFEYNFVETEKRSFCSGWTIYKKWSLNTSIFLLTWAHVLVVVNRLRKLRKGTKKYAWTSVTLWPKCQCTHHSESMCETYSEKTYILWRIIYLELKSVVPVQWWSPKNYVNSKAIHWFSSYCSSSHRYKKPETK